MITINPVQLRANLSEESHDLIFQRGKNYFHQGRVISLKFDDPDDQNCVEISAKVRGSRTYKTFLIIHEPDASIANYECTCLYYDSMCKHVVALGLAAIDYLEDKEDSTIKREVAYTVVKPMEKKLPALPILRDGNFQDNEALLLQKLSGIGIDSTKLSNKVIEQIIAAIPNTVEYRPPIKVKKLIPKKPFNERYYVSVGSSYDGLINNVNLSENRSQSHQYFYYDYQSLDIKKILDKEQELTQEHKEMLDMIDRYHKEYNRNEEKQKVDIVKILCLARFAGIDIKLGQGYFEKKKISWVDSAKLHVTMSEKQHNSLYGNYIYSVINIDFSKSLNFKSCFIVAGNEGLIVIEGGFIRFHAMPSILANIVKRAMKDAWRRSYEYDGYRRVDDESKSNGVYTDLSGDEYEHTNRILVLFKEYFVCDSKLTESYQQIEIHKPVPVIVIDYDNEKSIINVWPSVDYGGVTLPVCDTTYFSHSTKNPGVTRRIDAAFGVSHVVRIISGKIHISQVDTKMEKQLFNLGRERGEELGIHGNGRGLYRGQKQIVNFIQQYLPKIKKLEYEIRYTRDIPREVIDAEFRADFDIDFNAENDWLAFDLALYCGSERIQLSDIEACLKNKYSQVTLKDGRIIRIINPEALKRLVLLLTHFRKNDFGVYEGKSYHAPELEAVAKGSLHYTSRVSEAFSSFISEAKQGKLVKSIKIPKIFKSVLRDYQVEGVHWLHFLHQYKFAGILADDMGLGKTLQTLAILSIHAKKNKPSLVISPKTLLYNWEQEVKKFAPHLKTIIIDGTQSERESKIVNIKKYDLVITSYPALQRDVEIYEKHQHCFNYCVLDEAQYVKNPRTKGSHTVRKMNSDYRLALSGTPLENGVLELWSQFDFLMPGFLGHHAHFKKHISNPIMKYSDQDALKGLRAKVECFVLRRTKEKVLMELPPKVEQVVVCELTDDQNILYQDVLRRVRNDITTQVKKAGFAASQIHILAGLTRLRQICNHPALVLPAKKRGVYPSVKLDECIEIVKQICEEKRKILVFSSFTKMLDIIARSLDEKKISYVYLSGQTKNRKTIIDLFNNDSSIPVFLISTKAGGVGLNLTSADAVIIFDPWWNPQVEKQAIDRTHRIGQTKSVHVYRLRTKGTIEEKIVALQERKQKLFNALVDDSKDIFKKLTWEDVKSLLS